MLHGRTPFTAADGRRLVVHPTTDPDPRMDQGYREVCENNHAPQEKISLGVGLAVCPVCPGS
jgi:hypothetical protein